MGEEQDRVSQLTMLQFYMTGQCVAKPGEQRHIETNAKDGRVLYEYL